MSVLHAIIQARSQFERHSIPKSLLISIYKDYQDVGDIEAFISRAEDLFPRLNCGIASLYLQHILGVGEIILGSYLGNSHTFLQYQNSILDITADQYGGPPIYIGPLHKPWKK